LKDLSINWIYYPQKGKVTHNMTVEQIKERLEVIATQLNERANQLLAADPVACELLGLKKGMEMCIGDAFSGEPEGNGEVEREESIEAIAGG